MALILNAKKGISSRQLARDLEVTKDTTWRMRMQIRILNAKKGISSRQLARDIEVTKDTAWRMQMQIRKAMIETPSLMTGICEMDENYIGARKPRRESKGKDENGNYPKNPRGRGTKNKTSVVGALQRGGKIFTRIQSA